MNNIRVRELGSSLDRCIEDAIKRLKKWPGMDKESDLAVFSFPQMWSSTALGFGGIAGQAMTTAQTTVIVGPVGDACAYFAGRFAYHIDKPNNKLGECIRDRAMLSVKEAHKLESK